MPHSLTRAPSVYRMTMTALARIAWVILLAAPVWLVACIGVGRGLEDRELQSDLSGLLAGQDGKYGIAVVNLDDDRTALLNADDSFPAASMYKLLVMYRVFQAIDRGKLSPDSRITIQGSDATQDEPDGGFGPGDTPTIRQALAAMITVSSNAAAFALTREVGGWSQIESASGELGMSNTTSVDGYLWSTPRDMAHFFQLLDNRSLVSPRASEQMLDLLLQQTINDRLPALLPPNTAVAHKTGDLEDVRNDGGIVYGHKGHYVIVLMSREGTPAEEIQTEAELSERVYAEYGQ